MVFAPIFRLRPSKSWTQEFGEVLDPVWFKLDIEEASRSVTLFWTCRWVPALALRLS